MKGGGCVCMRVCVCVCVGVDAGERTSAHRMRCSNRRWRWLIVMLLLVVKITMQWVTSYDDDVGHLRAVVTSVCFVCRRSPRNGGVFAR